MALHERREFVPKAWLAGFLLIAVLLPAVASKAGAWSQTTTAGAPQRHIILIGLDAADWLTIDALAGAGKLPAFARLKAAGHAGVMYTTPPLLSPIIWTTIATGMPPEEHGILDFMVDLQDGSQAPIGSTHRLVPALWNLFSDAGRTVGVVGWWATWPAETVHGVIVSDGLAPQLIRPSIPGAAGLVHPDAMLPRVRRAIVRPEQVTFEDLVAYVPLTRREFDEARAALGAGAGRLYQNKIAHLAAAVASARTYAAVAIDLARTERPDLLAVYVEDIDTISHLFVTDPARGPRAIERVYRDADDLILAIASASPPDTLVVVCSDHGFYPASAGVTEDPSNLTGPATAWHRPYGIVAIAEARDLAGARDLLGSRRPAPGSAASAGLGTIAPIDLAPTLLHLAGLPVTTEMPGRVVASMLPADLAARPVAHRAAPRYEPPALPQSGRPDQEEALARLRALGYIGTVKTSLARQNLGEIFVREGKYPAAERELRAVLEIQPQNLNAHLWLAKSLEAQGRAGEALRIYERAIVLPDGAPSALVEAVDLAVESRQLEAADGLIAKVPAGRANDVPLAVARGTVAEARGQVRAAEREFRAALAIDALSFDAADRLLTLAIAAGRADSLLPLLRRAMELAPQSPRHLGLMGTALLATHDPAAAEIAFDKALALAPESDALRVSLGRALLGQQKTDRAIAVLLPAGASVERSTLLGAAYSAKGRWADAARELRAALNGGAATTDVLNALGWAQLRLGQRDEAAKLLTRSLELNPNQPEIRKLLDGLRSPQAGTAR